MRMRSRPEPTRNSWRGALGRNDTGASFGRGSKSGTEPGSAADEDRSATGRRRVYHVLDLVRGVAALVVVQRHTAWLFGTYQWPGTFLAVDLFFVLSGFVIAHSYQARLLGGEPWWRFMGLRLIRLYPLYLVGMAIGIVALLGHQAHRASGIDPGLVGQAIFSAAFMLPNWGVPAIIGPRWSLTYELVANGVYAGAIRQLSPLVTLLVIAVSGAALIVIAAHTHSLDGGWQYSDMPLALARVGYSFFAGTFLYRVHAKQTDGKSFLLFLGTAGCLAVCAVWRLERTAAAETVIVLLAFPLLTLAAAAVDVRGWWAQLCGFLGVISYAAYVIHEPASHLFDRLVVRSWGINTPGAGWLFLVLLLLFCWLADRYYDRPARRYLTRMLAPSHDPTLQGSG